MKFVALVSGGKDSIYSILECHRQGHELVACVHLGRPDFDTEQEEESYMYQTAASETIKTLVEECLEVPLILYTRKGTSLNTSLVYQETSTADEVEDLYHALLLAKERFPQIEAVASGAILSTYQRVRVENVASRLGLTSLSFLWRRAPQHVLLQHMLDDGITAVLVRTAAPPGLVPRKHLNRTLQELQGHFHTLHDLYQFHVCGEGGEFETLCLDSPIHRKRLVLDDVEISESDDGTGNLLIRSCHAEPKADSDFSAVNSDPKPDFYTAASETAASIPDSSACIHIPRIKKLRLLPHAKTLNGGLLHFSEILSPEIVNSGANESEADLAISEAKEVLAALDRALQGHGCTAMDVMMVHLYLSEISHFRLINEHYRNFFGTVLPPSRSCVAVGRGNLPSGRRVLLDCLVQRGSGKYMRTLPSDLLEESYPAVAAAHATSTSKLRDVLHVQSRSHWAPVCVGPYSQVNTLRSVVHFLAGQIGLEPASMTLRPTWKEQLVQTWRNVAQVLDALDGGSMDNLLSGMVYVSDTVGLGNGVVPQIELICREQLETNCGVVPGSLERGPNGSNLTGYEDEETMQELTQPDISARKVSLPILAVSIPEMPVGALVEVEVIAATCSFASCVDMANHVTKRELSPAPRTPEPTLGWDTGHDFDLVARLARTEPQIEFDLSFRSMGNNCIACATVAAIVIDRHVDSIDIDAKHIFEAMITSLELCPSFNMAALMNLRVYYICTLIDGTGVRSAFQAAAGATQTALPATTFVPVSDMCILLKDKYKSTKQPVVAFQATSLDAVKTETCRWVNRGR